MNGRQEQLEAVGNWLGCPISETQTALLQRFADWLVEEAIAAGGMGPDEAPRIWDRHVCDSLSFAAAWPEGAPSTAADLGTGVGLPGIPLAILWPETRWSMIDRSGKRIQLTRRALRILRLPNVETYHEDLRNHGKAYDAVVARGVSAPHSLAQDASHTIVPGGRLAIGLTRRCALDSRLDFDGKVITVPPEVLDGGSRILIIDSRD